MGYRLQMSAEIYDWLADLRDGDPPAAELAARALAALADGGDRLGPPVVTAAPVPPHPDELRRALDQHYQDRLEWLNALRGRIAELAVLRQELERLASPARRPGSASPGLITCGERSSPARTCEVPGSPRLTCLAS